MNRVETTVLDIDSPEWTEKAGEFAELVLDRLDLDEWEVSLVFCGDGYIRTLNYNYRNIDEPTDVLSFPQEDGPPGTETPYVAGDIIISLDTLSTNSVSFNVDKNEELKRLIIHGILHLTGRDHKTNDEREEMLQLQEKLLLEIGEDIF